MHVVRDRPIVQIGNNGMTTDEGEHTVGRNKGFVLLELGAVCGIGTFGALLFSALFGMARPRARLAACMNNCKSIADGFAQYCNDPINQGNWMWINGNKWDTATGANQKTDYPAPGKTGKRAITELLFMLVKRDMGKMEHFICPADKSARTQQVVDLEYDYDFQSAANVSYSYTAPLAGPGGRTQSGASPKAKHFAKVAVLADQNNGNPKGPWTDQTTDDQRRTMISQNHNGDGFNVVFQSFDVKGEFRADIGVDHDNINAAGDPPSPKQTEISFVRANKHDSCVIGPFGQK